MGTNDLPQQESRSSRPHVRRFGAAAAHLAAKLKKGGPLPTYALHYFDTMAARFKSLPEPPATEAAAHKIWADAEAVVDTAREKVTWEQLLLLDLLLTRGLAFEELVLRVADLRARLADSMTPPPEGLAVKLDIADKEKDQPKLRAEAECLVTRSWLMRMARDARDDYVGALRGNLLWFLAWTVGIFGTAVYVLGGETAYAPLFLVICVAGMLGALVSIVRRLQNVVNGAPSPDQGADLSALAHEKRVTVLSMVVGAVFAIVLYALFVAGLGDMGGDLTPKFTEARGMDGVDFWSFVNEVGPRDGKSYAKVIVWSFIAGFFEQFVPDVLDRIARKKP